jgi:hypothetical protein
LIVLCNASAAAAARLRSRGDKGVATTRTQRSGGPALQPHRSEQDKSRSRAAYSTYVTSWTVASFVIHLLKRRGAKAVPLPAIAPPVMDTALHLIIKNYIDTALVHLQGSAGWSMGNRGDESADIFRKRAWLAVYANVTALNHLECRPA